MLSSQRCLLYSLTQGLLRLKQIIWWVTKKAWDGVLIVQHSHLSSLGKGKSETLSVHNASHYAFSMSKIPEQIQFYPYAQAYKSFSKIPCSKGLACFLEIDLCYMVLNISHCFLTCNISKNQINIGGEHSESKKSCIWIGKHMVQADIALVPWKLIFFFPPSIFEQLASIQF